MTFLITGGSGFIGSHLVEALQGRGTIRVLDNLRTGFRKNLDGMEVEFYEGSVLDQALVAQVMVGVDYVFHLAAMVSVPESVANPRECEELNGFGLLNVLEAAAAAGAKKVFFASSAAVYGDNTTVPKVETMIPEPKSPYAFTKLLGEHYCRFFHDERRVNTACLRFFNVFGPRQDPKGPYAAAVAIFMAKALRGEPILIHGDGEQTRDFIYVKDIVAAILHVTLNEGITGVFNAGYGGSVTLNEIAEFIVQQANSGTEIHHGPVRAGDVKHSRAAVDLLRETGFQPVSSLQQGLAAMIELGRNS